MKQLARIAFELLQKTVAEVQTDHNQMDKIATKWLKDTRPAAEISSDDRRDYDEAKRRYQSGMHQVDRICKALDEEA